MQGDVAPMANDAWTRLSPGISSFSGHVIPMKWLRVELPRRPSRKRTHCSPLTYVRALCSRSVRRLRELIFKSLIGSNTDQENTSAILRYTEILGIKHSPFHAITCRAVSRQLICEQVVILAEHHSINI